MGWMDGIAGKVAAGSALAEGASGLIGAAGEGAAAIGNGAKTMFGLGSDAAGAAEGISAAPSGSAGLNPAEIEGMTGGISGAAGVGADSSQNYASKFLSSMWDQVNPAKGWNKNDPASSLGGMVGSLASKSSGEEMKQAPGYQEFKADDPTAGQGMIFDAETELNKLRSRMNQ